MKIALFEIETLRPQYGSNEYYEIADTLNCEHLKYGTATFIKRFSHWITKTELKKIKNRCVSAKYYDRNCEIWRNGVLLTQPQNGKYLFAQYSGTF